MRLWHQDLIELLPRQQLLGQWRECIALLGLGWGKKHSVVDYVFGHPEENLVVFAVLVACEMERRGYKSNVDLIRSALLKRHDGAHVATITHNAMHISDGRKLYPEHNDEYFKECCENLARKGVDILGNK